MVVVDDVTDDELAALALAADPDQPLDPDAVPISLATGVERALLPEWYMPVPMATSTGGAARRWLLGALVVALVVISGVGLCVTYGLAEIAW